MSDRRDFDHRDLSGPDGVPVDDALEVSRTARTLEKHAAAGDIAPSAGFVDVVMAAIADEPAPRPASVLAAAIRRGSLAGIAVALGDSWRVAWGAGRPVAVRAQALAIVAVVMFAVGSTAAIGAVGLGRLVAPGPTAQPVGSPDPSTVIPTSQPSRSPEPTAPAPTSSPEASETPETASPEASESPEASPHAATARPDDANTASPAETARPSDRPTSTPEPPSKPKPTPTPEPTESPTPTDVASPTPDAPVTPAPTPEPTGTPERTATPRPTETPEHT
jgi:hypothetical protein